MTGTRATAPRILVLEPVADAGPQRLRDAGCEVVVCDGLDEAIEKDLLAGAAALVVRSGTRVDRSVLERAPSLVAVGRAGVGLDNVDLEAATERGVAVLNTPGGNALAAGELTLALLLGLSRRVVEAHQSLVAGRWERHLFVGRELAGKTLGLVGLGRVGTVVARRALAFDMTVRVFDPYLTDERARALGVRRWPLEKVLAESDVVSLHAPLTPETEGLLDAARLRQMKKGALLVNCARGGLVDEAALAEVLREGHLGGAAVDVFRHEPPEDSPLLGAPGLVHTPHLGASTVEAKENVSLALADGLLAILRDGDYSPAVNLPFAAGDLRPLRELLDLAQRLGRFQGGLAEDAPRRLEVEIAAEEGFDPTPVGQAVLTGFLQSLGTEEVNAINAARRADAMGLTLAVARSAPEPGLPQRIRTRVVESDPSPDGPREVDGALLAPQAPRIINVDGRWIDFEPAGTALVLWNRDRPGVIGRVGEALGQAGVNIAELRLGRREGVDGAISVWQVDAAVSPELLERLRRLEDVDAVRQVHLGDRRSVRR